MALPDILWACPECERTGSIDPDGRCPCGVRFTRGQGSTIRATHPDGRVLELPASEWLDRLPAPATLLGAGEGGSRGSGRDARPVRQARVRTRKATGEVTVRARGRFLNRIERYGTERHGTLTLTRDALLIATEGTDPETWGLERLAAIQASSRALQIRPRGQPLVSFEFVNDSIYLWESLLHAALRDFYGRTGRGEIVEFQPRIETRP
jgi:hypothetical protein